ncbi:hypothetical protein LshimejAT787_2000370 [Lyophyllum shimeji]|uniref:Uncharacterized protein n=1 Tax=Lyophyllum shimeji TaxID=47721 RepID=A0A9P3UUG5_LYOSH|nr:hypothetical protein LshimejAT787_2000370 [Lyophyllum shimeji]
MLVVETAPPLLQNQESFSASTRHRQSTLRNMSETLPPKTRISLFKDLGIEAGTEADNEDDDDDKAAGEEQVILQKSHAARPRPLDPVPAASNVVSHVSTNPEASAAAPNSARRVSGLVDSQS